MKFRNVLAAFVLGVSASSLLVHAQQVGAYASLGSAHDSSNGAQIDTFGDGELHSTPKLRGLFGTIGGSVFLTRHVGLGADLSWRMRTDYAGIQYRASFSNFDVIFRSAGDSTKREAPEFRLGLGSARIHYSPDDPQSCDQLPGCPSSHHFQMHLGIAAPLYFTKHVYLRPAFDLHYVRNLFEFGSNWVPHYSVGLGYSFGRE